MAKLDVQATTHVIRGSTPVLVVSVSDGQGQPLLGLAADRFSVSVVAVHDDVSWKGVAVTGVTSLAPGVYGVFLERLDVILPGILAEEVPWFESSDWVMSVSVDTAAGDRGQALGVCHLPCGGSVEISPRVSQRVGP